MERLIKKRDGVRYQVDCIYDYVKNVTSEDGEHVKTTAKVLAKKQNALAVYKERYDEILEELLIEASTTEAVQEIHSSYKCFQEKCTGIEEIIDIIEENYFSEDSTQATSAAASSSTFDATLLQAVNQIVNNQMESLQRMASQQEKSLKDILSSKNVSASETKLPQLDLKSFSGGYAQWSEFYDTFSCVVDSRSNLAPVQKLQYLKSCLKEEAATLVKNLSLNDANYPIAISSLKARYENVKNIRKAHFDAIFNVSSVTKKNAYNLRKLIAVFDENLKALENLNEPVNQWNSWLVYLLKKKLDSDTRFEWEKLTASVVNPTYKQMYDFVAEYAYALEASEEKAKYKYKANQSSSTSTTTTTSSKCFNVTQADTCFLCKEDHRLAFCPEYTSLDPHQRKAKVLDLKLCVNCFSRQHFVSRCPKPSSCRSCKRKHHPTLHYDEPTKQEEEVSSHVSTIKPEIVHKEVLLATALVYVRSGNGNNVLCRALIDPGSQISFVTKGCAQRLKIEKSSLNNGINVNGIGGISKGTLDRVVCLNISSIYSSDVSVVVNALTIDQVTSNIPRRHICELNWPGLKELQLADEHFCATGAVDILLGADVHPYLILDGVGVRKSPDCALIAQQSIFGWIITGSTAVKSKVSDGEESALTHLVETEDVLKKFWEIEDTPCVKPWSIEEKLAEEHFKETTFRNENGQYVVELPFKDNCVLGESRAQALQRLQQMERRYEGVSGLKSC